MGKTPADELAGVVRITVPSWRDNDEIIRQLLTALEPYPQIVLDWREDMGRLDNVAERIDIGVRIGLVADENFIVREIAKAGDILQKVRGI